MGSPPPHDVRVAVEEVFFDDDLNAEDPNLVELLLFYNHSECLFILLKWLPPDYTYN